MSWLLPSAFLIGGLGALAAIALHFISRSRPLAEPLPTARFVPQRSIRARTRSYALNDVLLLLLRIAAILAITAAVAGPAIASAHGRTARIVLIDQSRAVAAIDESRDSARAVFRPGDVAIVFDSVATRAPRLDSLAPSGSPGSISTGLVAALRVGSALAERADSIELVLVSPLAAEEFDSATSRIRATWPGRVRLIHVAGARLDPRRVPIESATDANDLVIAGLSLAAHVETRAPVRIVRGRTVGSDSLWARDSGHVLVHWPAADTDAVWPQRKTIDAVGAVASRTGSLVARLPRIWQLSGPAVAWWADGSVAAVERPIGRGCIRDVGILFDPAGDLTLRPEFREVALALLAPCGGSLELHPATAPQVASIVANGPMASAALLRDRQAEASRWTPWLLALAALLLIAELAMRRSHRSPA